jgi:signal transduction histidine kinase
MEASSTRPSLSDFLRTHAEDILRSWDEVASSVPNAGAPLDAQSLRDHGSEILAAIAADMGRPQSEDERRAKSRGEAPAPEGLDDTAAQTHADGRIESGSGVLPMMTEYRALRASVLHLWGKSGPQATSAEVEQITRFNEAIDQAIIEAVARYTQRTKHSTDLFIGVLGHDIRNPLSTIAMSLEALTRTGRLDEAAARPIRNGVERIRSVIEQIVDFTRAQAGQPLSVTCTQGDLANHAEEIAEETRVRYPGVTLTVERDGVDFEGCWDKGRVGQLLSNLLANALQYGDRSRPVTLRLVATEGAVAVEVRNYGQVIPAAERARIFEPLMRGRAASSQGEPSGLGLGLYICREIVRAHGGRIEARSDEAEGTRFIAHLPRRGAGQPPAGS